MAHISFSQSANSRSMLSFLKRQPISPSALYAYGTNSERRVWSYPKIREANLYPATYFGLFPPFPRQDTVFVAISFDDRFNNRWTEVIEKGIKNVQRNGKALEAVRVDTRRISDSILTEILSGIGTSRLVLADVTTIGYLDNKRAVRNANVMYEVGIAHATRLPEEVLLFRSDKDPLLFDLSNVRVNEYAPDEKPEETRALITKSIVDALKELDLRRSLVVKQTAESLDYMSWEVLLAAAGTEPLVHPGMNTMGEALGNAPRMAAIQRLLELGVLQTTYLTLTAEIYSRVKETQHGLFAYKCTEFGRAVFRVAVERLGLRTPEMRAVLQKEREQMRLELQARLQEASGPQEQSDLEAQR